MRVAPISSSATRGRKRTRPQERLDAKKLTTPGFYRPVVELLEDRLPPGDTLFSLLFAASIGSDAALLSPPPSEVALADGLHAGRLTSFNRETDNFGRRLPTRFGASPADGRAAQSHNVQATQAGRFAPEDAGERTFDVFAGFGRFADELTSPFGTAEPDALPAMGAGSNSRGADSRSGGGGGGGSSGASSGGAGGGSSGGSSGAGTSSPAAGPAGPSRPGNASPPPQLSPDAVSTGQPAAGSQQFVAASPNTAPTVSGPANGPATAEVAHQAEGLGSTAGSPATLESQAGATASSAVQAMSPSTRIGFAKGLQGWNIDVVGGSEEGQGSVTAGSAILREGDSFLVALQKEFVVPENPARCCQTRASELDCEHTHRITGGNIPAHAPLRALRGTYHGAGQQQLRNSWANIAAWHLTMWLHTLIELWAWHKPHKEVVDRSASPWDDADRRPSHADRRNALRRSCLEQEYQRDSTAAGFGPKTRRLWARLLQLAA